MRGMQPFVLLLVALLLAAPVSANDFFSQFIDPMDGKLDTSQWQATSTGFLPIPIFVSDSAAGHGGGLGLAFFHEFKDEPIDEGGEDDILTLSPSVSFALVAVTINNSWLAGGGGFRYPIARRVGLRVGLDLAVGPEDTVLYMGFGSAWR